MDFPLDPTIMNLLQTVHKASPSDLPFVSHPLKFASFSHSVLYFCLYLHLLGFFETDGPSFPESYSEPLDELIRIKRDKQKNHLKKEKIYLIETVELITNSTHVHSTNTENINPYTRQMTVITPSTDLFTTTKPELNTRTRNKNNILGYYRGFPKPYERA